MFIFSLAETLHMDIDKVMAMPSKQLLYWRAYFNLKDADYKRKAAEAKVKSAVHRRIR